MINRPRGNIILVFGEFDPVALELWPLQFTVLHLPCIGLFWPKTNSGVTFFLANKIEDFLSIISTSLYGL